MLAKVIYNDVQEQYGRDIMNIVCQLLIAVSSRITLQLGLFQKCRSF